MAVEVDTVTAAIANTFCVACAAALPQGPTHPMALKRMFGTTEPPRVKLYRDHASW